MFSLKIGTVPTLFIKAFTGADVNKILDFVRESASSHSGEENKVLFVDTPITSATVEAVERLKAEGYRVFFRDHHAVDGEPSNDRERQVCTATARLRQVLGEDCCITVRRLHPACSTLVSVGEFSDAIAIIADPDADGLTAAMKAAGFHYEGMDDDAAKLDGEPQIQVSGTPISRLLAKGVATIPSYDPRKPGEREIAYQKLFADWFNAVRGNESARKRLEERVVIFDSAAALAIELARTAVHVSRSVFLVDAVDKELFDPGTLHRELEKNPECAVIVVRKSLGPIAALHGIQYSLSVARSFKDRVNLNKLLHEKTRSDPRAGVISNVSFLLHVSEEVWNRDVFPRLSELEL